MPEREEHMNTIKRISVAGLFALASFGVSVAAFAQPSDAKQQCDGKHGKGEGKGAHFKKADKNNDGFLTKAEVGDRRWERIKIADANNDGKVSQPELQQAHKDGKLPKHHGKRDKA
jgi:hypothetical protein